MKKEYLIPAAMTLLVLIIFYYLYLSPIVKQIQPIADASGKAGSILDQINLLIR